MNPTNTHILAAEFGYVAPDTLDEVLVHLSENGAQARLLAGGTDLLVQMKMERESPAMLINLSAIPELKKLTMNGGLSIGATASIQDIAASEDVRHGYTALAESCVAFSTKQIMVMATIGGNLANGSPAADTAPALLAFDASVNLVSRAGERTLRLEEFFVGPGQTTLRTDEVVRSVHLAEPVRGTASAFLKVGRVLADISQVCAAVRIVRSDDRVLECRIALGSVAPTPIRARRAEEHLTGRRLDRAQVEAVARGVAEETSPITDVRSTEQHRRHLTGIVVRDAIRCAWARAGGGELL